MLFLLVSCISHNARRAVPSNKACIPTKRKKRESGRCGQTVYILYYPLITKCELVFPRLSFSSRLSKMLCEVQVQSLSRRVRQPVGRGDDRSTPDFFIAAFSLFPGFHSSPTRMGRMENFHVSSLGVGYSLIGVMSYSYNKVGDLSLGLF